MSTFAIPVLLLVFTAGPGDPTEHRFGPLIRHTSDGLVKQRPSWSPDGKRLAFARHEAGGTHIWQYLMEVEPPAVPRRLTQRNAPEFDGVFAPDGQHLLFVTVTLSGTQGNLDIAAIRADGSGLETVARDTSGLSHQEWPAWSPDGQRFAFSSTHEKNQEIYTARRDGKDVVRVTQSPGVDAHPCWSPDGRWIYFATDRWGGLELARVHPDGSGLARLTASPGLDDYPALSPDGRRLAFVSNRDGQYEIYVASSDGTNPINLTRHPRRDTYPTWTPDGLGVTFVSEREGGVDLFTQRMLP
jgi:TolB protein